MNYKSISLNYYGLPTVSQSTETIIKKQVLFSNLCRDLINIKWDPIDRSHSLLNNVSDSKDKLKIYSCNSFGLKYQLRLRPFYYQDTLYVSTHSFYSQLYSYSNVINSSSERRYYHQEESKESINDSVKTSDLDRLSLTLSLKFLTLKYNSEI